MLKRRILELLFVALAAPLVTAQAPALRQFLQAPQYSTGIASNPQAVAVADFNNDGIPDVAVANATANSVSIFLGNGDGTFRQANCAGTTLNCSTGPGTNPQGIAAGDFYHNGNMDLAVTNYAAGTITILSNSGQFSNGQGGFTVQSTLTVGTGTDPRGIALADFNGDGYPDIVVANYGTHTLAIIMNNGSGGFNAQPTYTYNTASNPWAVAVGDLNNDGIPDVVVADNNDNNIVSVFLGQATNGVFSGLGQQVTYFAGTQGQGATVSVALGDFNGDGNLDAAVAIQSPQGTSGLDTLSIMTGDGTGTLTLLNQSYPTAPNPVSVVAADLNGDGNLDLALAAGDGNIVTVFWGNGNATFGGQVNCGTGDIPSAVAAANLTNSSTGQQDLIVTNAMGNSFSAIMNNGNQTFQSRLDYVAGTNPQSVVTADFNADGIPDLAVVDSATSTMVVTLGNGDGTFQTPTKYTTGTATNPVFIVEGDFNQDGIPDLAVVNNATSTVSVFIGQATNGVANGTFAAHQDYNVGNPLDVHPVALPTSAAVGDFNGDGYPDIAVTNSAEGSVSILLNYGKGNANGSPGTFALGPNCSPENACLVGSDPTAIATGYFDGNQTLDLVVINETANNATILLGNGDGTFTAAAATPAVGNNPVSVAVADLNGDGIPDLAVADQATPAGVSVLFGNGNGTFQNAVAYGLTSNPTGVVIGDFNGDGIPDLALASPSSGANPGNLVSLLLGVPNLQSKASGTFGTAAIFGAGYLSSSLIIGDFNLDGALDLATVNPGSNTVSILLNLQGTKINFAPSANPTTYGQSLTLTATVAASVTNAMVPTGSVTFENGSTIIGTQNLVNGQASVSTSALPAGVNSLAAVYSGDSNYQPHTVDLSQTVSPASSSTSLASTPDPAPPNSTVTFTATVSSTTTQPTGAVTFFNGATQIGTGSLNPQGQATLSTSNLPMGTSNVSAVYAGNSNVTGSTGSTQQVIGKANTTIVLTSNPTSANLNQSVTFTATVSGALGVPTGTVTFFSGTTQLGTGTLNGGVATYSTSSLAAGTDSISASYSGDTNFLSSTSSAMSLVVTAPNFSLAANWNGSNSIAPGASATATVTISPVGGLNPSTVALTCTPTPTATPAPTCSLGAISVVNGNGAATLTFTAAAAQSALAMPAGARGSFLLLAVGLMIPAMLLGGAGLSKPGRKKLMNFCLFLVLAGCMAHVACGGGSGSTSTTPPPSGNSGTPAGVYKVAINGSASGIQQSLATPLSVTVQ